MTEAQIKRMVNRFLCWRLPENFAPDGGISFKAAFNEHTAHPMKHEPTGTNLFDATQAEAMVRFIAEGIIPTPSGETDEAAFEASAGSCSPSEESERTRFRELLGKYGRFDEDGPYSEEAKTAIREVEEHFGIFLCSSEFAGRALEAQERAEANSRSRPTPDEMAAEVGRLRAALNDIAEMCPATQEISTATMMGSIAIQAL